MIDRPPSNFWHAVGAVQTTNPPRPGQLVAFKRAVWRVDKLTMPAELDDRDRGVWESAGRPDPARPDTWSGWPYLVDMTWVGGHRPAPPEADGIAVRVAVRIGASRWGDVFWWNLYPGGRRWVKCSCCGEPAPCPAELVDVQADAALAELDKHAVKLPGCCWYCTEPITHRQDAVVYAGDNLDLPCGPEVRFHTRAMCIGAAREYERRWIAVDLRRERILTWPDCPGVLIVHFDGSSTCHSGELLTPDLFDPDVLRAGRRRDRAGNCAGHITHDHAMRTICRAAAGYVALDEPQPPCNCPDDRHWWIDDVLPPRPARRDREPLY